MEQKIKKGGAYESPEVNVLDVTVEGVLCESKLGGNSLSVNPWERADEEDFWG